MTEWLRSYIGYAVLCVKVWVTEIVVWFLGVKVRVYDALLRMMGGDRS